MKEFEKITKKDIIKDISKRTNTNISDVRKIYNELENIVFEKLSSVNENQDMYIKLFKGIILEGVYVPTTVKTNNLTGKENLVQSKIRLKCNISRSYSEKLNS